MGISILPSMPRNPFPGFNTKTTGRSNKVKAVTKSAGQNYPIEFKHPEESLDTASTEKLAAWYEKIPTPVRNAAWSTIGAVATGALVHGIGSAVSAARNLVDESKYEAALKEAIKLSPSLQLHGYELLKSYMPLIIKSSPTVAREPRLLANYLESMIDAQGHLNMSTFSELTNLEGNVLRNNAMRNEMGNLALSSAIKGLTEGVGKGISQSATRWVSTKP